MTTTYKPIIPLFKTSNETPRHDGLLRAAARNPGDRFLAWGSNRAAVALAVQQIQWASPGGRFAHLTEAQDNAKGARVWLEHHGLDTFGKPLLAAA